MAISYDEALERMKKIIGAKREYDNAERNEPVITGDVTVTGSGKQRAAEQAKTYYDWLQKNGFEQIAGKLKGMGTAEAEEYGDKISKTLGRSKTRDYLYSLGEKYDLSKEDIDKLTVYNENTGEVSFGGKNLGTPIAEVDSRAYYDTDKLEEAFEDYKKRSGLTKSLKSIYREGAEELVGQRKRVIDKGDELFERSFSDPYSTRTAKAIMESYGIRGEQASRNINAAAAAKNSGNLDTSAMQAAAAANAANLARGHEAVRAAKNDDLANAYKALEAMGVNVNGLRDDISTIGAQDIAYAKQALDEKKTDNDIDISQKTAKNDINNDISARSGLRLSEDYMKASPYFKDGKYVGGTHGTNFKAEYDKNTAEISRLNEILSENSENGRTLTNTQRQQIEDRITQLRTNNNELYLARMAKIDEMARNGEDVSGLTMEDMQWNMLDSADTAKTRMTQLYGNAGDMDILNTNIAGDAAAQESRQNWESGENAADREAEAREAAAERAFEAQKNGITLNENGTYSGVSNQNYSSIGKQLAKNGLVKLDATGTTYIRTGDAQTDRKLIDAIMQMDPVMYSGEYKKTLLKRLGFDENEI